MMVQRLSLHRALHVKQIAKLVFADRGKADISAGVSGGVSAGAARPICSKT